MLSAELMIFKSVIIELKKGEGIATVVACSYCILITVSVPVDAFRCLVTVTLLSFGVRV